MDILQFRHAKIVLVCLLALLPFVLAQEDYKCTKTYQYWKTLRYTRNERTRYTVRCGWCGFRRCTRYRQVARISYRRELRTSSRTECCTGWRRDRYGKCSMAICDPPCHATRGQCIKPNECLCEAGFRGRTCVEDINECKLRTESIQQCDHICINTLGSYRCECSSGYRLDVDNRHKCKDINECSMSRTHNCQHTCKNNPGSYTCTCYNGYDLEPDGRECRDTMECANGQHNCQQICVEKPGGFVCNCRMGYELDNDGYSCSDTDECALGPPQHDCDHDCINVDGGFNCTCYEGYKLGMDDKTCFDIDECAASTMNCDMIQICNGTDQPSRNCFYVIGYVLNDENDCYQDFLVRITGLGISLSLPAQEGALDCSAFNCSELHVLLCQEVKNNLTCVCIQRGQEALPSFGKDGLVTRSADPSFLQRCQSEPEYGAFSCSIVSGFFIDIDNQFCQGDKKHNCTEMQVCKNTAGGYECPCKDGYIKNNVTQQCDDVDECSTDYMNCPDQQVQICRKVSDVNTTILCECHEGQAKVCDGKGKCNCLGLDVCQGDSCTCYQEHFLNVDNKPCKGGGCGEMIHDCTEMETCKNTIGGYICPCMQGFIRDQFGNCIDVDECREMIDACAHLCMNEVGNYSCDCVEGFYLQDDGYTCLMPMGLQEAYMELKNNDGLQKSVAYTFDDYSNGWLFPFGVIFGIIVAALVYVGRQKSEHVRKATNAPLRGFNYVRARLSEARRQKQFSGMTGTTREQTGAREETNVYIDNPSKPAPALDDEMEGDGDGVYMQSIVPGR